MTKFPAFVSTQLILFRTDTLNIPTAPLNLMTLDVYGTCTLHQFLFNFRIKTVKQGSDNFIMLK